VILYREETGSVRELEAYNVDDVVDLLLRRRLGSLTTRWNELRLNST
jgi:hypothetical protein